MAITLWGRRNSANVQKATWALGELGLEFEHHPVGGSFGGTKTPDYLSMNPNGVVPTLRDGDLTLFESDAILRYLARSYGAGSLWPSDPAELALADQWATWSSTTFYPRFFPLWKAAAFTSRANQDPKEFEAHAAGLQDVISVLDAALEGSEHLVGCDLTFGEFGPAILTRRAFMLPHVAPEAPNVRRWLDRLGARPAYAKHIEFPLGTCREDWLENERKYG